MDLFALAAYMKAKGIDLADIGAAPAGFGLGENNARSVSWNNAAFNNGFVREKNGSPDGEWWHGIVCKEYGTITTQLAFKPNNGVWLAAMRGRTSNGGYGEWEYVNPPMLPGVEYRTTERWKGKAVYTKLIDLPIVSSDINEGALHFDELASGVDTIVSAEYREIDGEMIHFGDRPKELTVSAGDVYFSIFDVEPDTITEATLLLKYTK